VYDLIRHQLNFYTPKADLNLFKNHTGPPWSHCSVFQVILVCDTALLSKDGQCASAVPWVKKASASLLFAALHL
jgi:hypothetical protein